MIKTSEKYKIPKNNSLDGDVTEQFYSLVEVAVTDVLFHIDLTYGTVGCCDDGCGIKTRIITTDINKVIEVVNSDVVVSIEIYLQYPLFENNNQKYEFYRVNEILSGIDSNGITAHFCKLSNNSVKSIGTKEKIDNAKNLKPLYKKGQKFYWKNNIRQ